MMLNDEEDLDALVDIWLATPEGEALWAIMWKWARTCDNWIMGRTWFYAMKKQFVQIMQWHLHLTVGDYNGGNNEQQPVYNPPL